MEKTLQSYINYLSHKNNNYNIPELLWNDKTILLHKYIVDEQFQERCKRIRSIRFLKEKARINLMINIDGYLRRYKIQPVFFKGTTLGTILYGDPLLRHIGDLDIYISPEYDDLVQEIISHDMGLSRVINKDEDKNMHTSFFDKTNNLSVELHKRFLPDRLNVDVSYLANNRKNLKIDNNYFVTLGTNEYIIYLIYHLYMHVYDELNSQVIRYFQNKSKINVENILDDYLYNCFEIALYFSIYKQSMDINFLRQSLFENNRYDDIMQCIFDYIRNIFGDFDLGHRSYVPTEVSNGMFIHSNTLSEEAIINNINKWQNNEIYCVYSKKGDKTLLYSKDIIFSSDKLLYYDETKMNKIKDKSIGTTKIYNEDEFLTIKYIFKKERLITCMGYDTDAYKYDSIGFMCASICEKMTYRYIYGIVCMENNEYKLNVYDYCCEPPLLLSQMCAKSHIIKRTSCYEIILSISKAYLNIDNEYELLFDIVFCPSDTDHKRICAVSTGTNKYTCFDPRYYTRICVKQI